MDEERLFDLMYSLVRHSTNQKTYKAVRWIQALNFFKEMEASHTHVTEGQLLKILRAENEDEVDTVEAYNKIRQLGEATDIRLNKVVDQSSLPASTSDTMTVINLLTNLDDNIAKMRKAQEAQCSQLKKVLDSLDKVIASVQQLAITNSSMYNTQIGVPLGTSQEVPPVMRPPVPVAASRVSGMTNFKTWN